MNSHVTGMLHFNKQQGTLEQLNKHIGMSEVQFHPLLMLMHLQYMPNFGTRQSLS